MRGSSIVGHGAAEQRANKPTQYGRNDTQLGAEMLYEDAQAVARAYALKLRETGLAKFYGVWVEKRRHGKGAVFVGRHDDKPMPVRHVS